MRPGNPLHIRPLYIPEGIYECGQFLEQVEAIRYIVVMPYQYD